MKKMKLLFCFTILSCNFFYAQEQVKKDTTAVESNKGSWDINLDLATRYIWRGQSWGGDYPVAQLYANYYATDKLSFGVWTTTNLQNKDYKKDDISPRGYREIDFIANYDITSFLTTSVQWYYWPSLEHQDGVSNKFTNFGNNSVNTIDLQFLFDFTDKGLPLWFTWSTFLAGNDFKYSSEEDTVGKQNFTTYLELGYTFELPSKLTLEPVVGVVLNNKAAYYSYADTDKTAFTNIGLKLSREFQFSDKITMPIWLSYTHNGSSNSFASPEGYTNIFKNYLVLGTTFTLAK